MTTTTQTTPLWKSGKFPGMEFCSSWSRLENEQPEVFKLIQPLGGSEGQDHEYSYKVYKNQWGLSIGRRKLSLQDIQKVATNPTTIVDERPPPRPSAFTTTVPPVVEQKTLPANTKQNGFEDAKSKQIKELHDSRVEVELQHVQAIREQTNAIREQTKLIGDLVCAVWELVQKQQ